MNEIAKALAEHLGNILTGIGGVILGVVAWRRNRTDADADSKDRAVDVATADKIAHRKDIAQARRDERVACERLVDEVVKRAANLEEIHERTLVALDECQDLLEESRARSWRMRAIAMLGAVGDPTRLAEIDRVWQAGIE